MKTHVPRPSQIEVQVHQDRTQEGRCDEGFVRVRRFVLKNRYPDGSWSEPYPYDVVERSATDAVAIVLYDVVDDVPVVCLRSALRPPLSFRPGYELPVVADGDTVIWEIPAGLIEADEKGEAGILGCAARETLEETGLDEPVGAFRLLGPPAALSPGVLAETVYFVVGKVDTVRRGEPTSDGSPVEAFAEVLFVPLSVALRAVEDGTVRDVKTEVGLRRFAAFWAERKEASAKS